MPALVRRLAKNQAFAFDLYLFGELIVFDRNCRIQ
jgi:hypothetical protein